MHPILCFLIATALPLSGPTADPQSRVNHEIHSGGKGFAESESFVVKAIGETIDVKEVADGCEGWRRYLAKKWLNEKEPHAWQPKCEVFVYVNRQRYLSSVGSGGVQTFGSSLVNYGGGRVSRRQIDLLIDTQGQLSALPHELTHVVLADAFAGQRPPAWLDEGVATLSDTERKQALHRRDCLAAIEGRSTIRLVELLTMNRISTGQRAAFYGQSISLVDFLSARRGPDRLIPFVRRAMAIGYNRALHEHFEIAGIGQLERLWRDSAESGAAKTQFTSFSEARQQRR